MRPSHVFPKGIVGVAVCLVFAPLLAWPQVAAPPSAQSLPVPQSRIVARVDDNVRVTLRGNTHPLAQAQYDRGAAPPDLPMARMLLVLKRSDAQEAALEKLLDDQQDQSSPSYHQWLTPDQFGQQFGPSDQDVQTVAAWLRSHGFQIGIIGRGRTVIEFSGTAAQVQDAFRTEIHKFTVNGEDHWANASDPQIPAALAPAVTGIVSLNNFPRVPLHRVVGAFTRENQTGKAGLIESANPQLTFGCGTNPNSGQTIYCNALVPYDFATIYNVLPLWQEASPIDGKGQVIAIVAESNISVPDVTAFRSSFGLPAYAPTCSTPPTAGCLNIILNGPDPGLVPKVETEADLDVEWSGGVAPNAMIDLVVSASTESSSGADLSSFYVVDNDLAPILSVSFGQCELFLGATGNQFFSNIWQQAAAQGISVFVGSGDGGSSGCDRYTGTTPEPAQDGLAVSGLASTPYNIAVGGTDFNDILSEKTYWNTSSNDPTTQKSALRYVPEIAWNESCASVLFSIAGFGSDTETNCNNTKLANWVVTIGSGGGQSGCTNPTGTLPADCAGNYPIPAWQAGLNVPLNGGRAVPDVSLFSGAGFSGNAYAICEADKQSGVCPAGFLGIGGTSASAPAFAGIMALVNQKTGSRQGNAGIVLYKLARKQSGANCNSSATGGPGSSCIFNDVTSGTNAMPCTKGAPDCTTSNANDQYGVLSGFGTSTGYDLATGLGSVNATNLVNNWSSITFLASATTLTVNGSASGPINIVHGANASVESTVIAGVHGTGTPTGQIALLATPNPTPAAQQAPNNFGLALGVDALPLANGAASSSTVVLPGGSYTLTAHYQGDATFGISDSNPGIPVTVTAEPSKTLISIPTFDPSTHAETGNTPTALVYGSPYVARIDVGNAQAVLSYPAKEVCRPPNCPTGTITWTDALNGASPVQLDGGIFSLNSEGYTEDVKVQLSGGSHVLAATYNGDNSYQPSTGTYAVTVTPVATSIGQSFNVISAIVGTPFTATVTGYSQALSGVAPTGTVTFYDGTTQIGTSGPIQGEPVGYQPQFFAEGTLTLVSGGARTITAQYSGDANYAASTTSTTVNALYPTTASLAVSPGTVNYGINVTITGVIHTAIPATNAALKPTGTVLVNGSLDGNVSPVTTTTTADASGNWQIQVSATATPSGSETFNLLYVGDSNYASVTGYSNFVTVNIPDFSIGPTAGVSISPVAGQAGSAQVTVTPLSQTPSPVTLSVYPPISISGYTIAITPQTINLSGAPLTANISLTPTVTAPASSVQSQVRRAGLIRMGRGFYWPLSAASGMTALLLISISYRRRYRTVLGLSTFCFVFFVLGCGGGSSSAGGGGGGGGGNGPQPTTITLSTSSAKIAQNSPLPITATVTSASGSVITGNVTFYNFGTAFGSGYSIVNGQYTFQGNIGQIGVYQVTASYSGDNNNLPSTTSAALIQTVTGSVAVTITGNTGSDSHSVPATIGLQ